MTTVNIDFEPTLAELQQEILALFKQLPRRVLRRALPDLRRLYRKEMQKAVQAATVRRTGRLYRSPRVKASVKGSRLVMLPVFTLTDFKKQPGYGRRGGHKSGQYAFVVNHSKPFIRDGIARFSTSPELKRILNAAFEAEVAALRSPTQGEFI